MMSGTHSFIAFLVRVTVMTVVLLDMLFEQVLAVIVAVGRS